jgi:K+-transporting ATPase ATPase A chain
MWLLPAVVLGTSVTLSVPLGRYLAWIFDGRYRPPDWLARLERLVDTGSQSWKQYAFSLLLFNSVMFVVGFALLALQPWLPFNPDDRPALAPTTIFNTVISFQSNTSLQHYAGEQHLSYTSQLTALMWNMFVSGATGLCALIAVIRGLRGDSHLGNYYLDMGREVAYVMVPLCLVAGVLLIAAGVPMTFAGAEQTAAQVISRGPAAAMIPGKRPVRGRLAGSGRIGAFSPTRKPHRCHAPPAVT